MSIKNFRHVRVPVLLLFFSMAAFAGCAAPKSTVKQAPPAEAVEQAAVPEQPAEPEKASLDRISVVGAGDAVLIETNTSVKYTAFRLSDPPRLIVDMPGVDVSDIESPLEVNNNVLTVIATSSYGEGAGKIARVEIGLREGIGHFVKSGEDSILVDLNRDIYIPGESVSESVTVAEVVAAQEGGAALVEEVLGVGEEGVHEEALRVAEEEIAPVEEELVVFEEIEPLEEVEPLEEIAAPEMEEPMEETAVPELVELLAEPAAPAEVVLEDATRLLSVDSSVEAGTTLIKIVADGAIGNYNVFGLDDPPRFVVDIWGVDNHISQNSVSIGGPHIERARIGKHPDKVRVVFDSNLEEFPSHLIDKKGDALLLAFGSAPLAALPEEPEVVEEPVEAEPEVVEESVEAEFAEANEVEKVDFRKLDGTARLTVETSDKPDYELKESMDGKTITLDINDALIAEELKATLDATELGTPVATISSFQASVAPEKDVRILVKLSEEAPYNVTEDERSISVDFPLLAAVAEDSEAMVAAELIEEAAAEEALPAKKYVGRRIDLDMVDADIRDVLKLLAEVSDLNIVASDDVKGQVTLRLKNVPWDQAFDLILKTKALDRVQEGNIVRVAPASKLAKERQEFLAAKKAEEKLEDLQTEFIRISYDEALSLESQVKKLLSDRGEATSHEPTNTLIIKDIRAGIDEALEYIKRVDIPTPQVLIEARIVEAENSFARDLGVQWGLDFRESGDRIHSDIFGSSSTFGQAIPSPGTQQATIVDGGVFPQEKLNFPGDVGVTNYAVDLPATGTAGALGGLGFILGKTGVNPLLLDLRITAGEQDGVVKTISRPRVITLDNKEAKIEQGESIPFETTSAAGTATTFIDANLSLTVTPQITPDGSVILEIKASRNSIGSFRTSSGEPSINKREASTEVLVKDGETTVIGGIVVSDTSKSDRGIPFFKDVPVLGWLFKAKSISDTQRELLIFITPSIIKDDDIG